MLDFLLHIADPERVNTQSERASLISKRIDTLAAELVVIAHSPEFNRDIWPTAFVDAYEGQIRALRQLAGYAGAVAEHRQLMMDCP